MSFNRQADILSDLEVKPVQAEKIYALAEFFLQNKIWIYLCITLWFLSVLFVWR